MKKIRVLSLILMLIIMSTYCFAHSAEHVYEYGNDNITIIFQENTIFSSEEQERIADIIVYGDNNEEISTYSLCWLTGHDTTSENVTSVQHKVSSSSPRCMRTLYTVTTCSKCDYEKIETLGSGYIYCCPEEGASAVSE